MLVAVGAGYAVDDIFVVLLVGGVLHLCEHCFGCFDVPCGQFYVWVVLFQLLFDLFSQCWDVHSRSKISTNEQTFNFYSFLDATKPTFYKFYKTEPRQPNTYVRVSTHTNTQNTQKLTEKPKTKIFSFPEDDLIKIETLDKVHK